MFKSQIMCGIFQVFNFNSEISDFEKSIDNGKHRGPDNSVIKTDEEYKMLHGFHRLSINGLDDISNQPIEIDNILLMCNGQIYNHSQLHQQYNWEKHTNSDCESIIHMYLKFGINITLDMLDGVFSFVLIDKRNVNNMKAYVVRDPFGVRPLFYASYKNIEDNLIVYASEVKMFTPLDSKYDLQSVESVTPGTYQKLIFRNDKWLIKRSKSTYFDLLQDNTIMMQHKNLEITSFNLAKNAVKHTFTESVKKRVENTEKEIACLLSGGLDSSLVAALVQSMSPTPIRTYSIGLKGSEDLKYAELVADHINSIHTSVIIEEKDFLEAIPKVIHAIESFDTTTVRASVGNYLVAKYISEHSDAKVIFNGDGSDEVCGGYLYFHESPDAKSFSDECHRLLKDIHKFDVLRSDRSISSHGLEARTPFLDKTFVKLYMSISPDIRFIGMKNNKNQPVDSKICEKFLLRSAFEDSGLLPNDVLWRKKEAFSDGVSSIERSWYQIIQEHVQTCLFQKFSHKYLIPQTKEQEYYRCIFHTRYGRKYEKLIPYFWMPKFVKNATDASARTLDIYTS